MTTKDELLAQLFALRAGMSAISIQTEHVKNDERILNAEKNKLSDTYDQIHIINKQEAEVKRQLNDANIQYGSLYDNRDEEIEKRTKAALKKTSYLSTTLFWSIFIGFIATAPIVLLALGYTESGLIIMAVVGWIIVFSVIVIYKILVKRLRDKQAAEIDKTLSELEKSINSANRALALNKSKRKEWLPIIENAENERDYNIEVITERISARAEIAMSYNNALEEKFAELLNPADWQNIDLCIYYLQTGRADSIKECLQLVDRQRQTDEIINAVQQASDRICNEIHSGFNALGRTMVSCFNSISNQLESISNQIANEHASLIATLGEINASNVAILSATQLNNALLAKANVSSEQLASDIHYLRQYA